MIPRCFPRNMQHAGGTVSSWVSAAGWAGQAAVTFQSAGRIRLNRGCPAKTSVFRLDITGDAVSDTMLSRDIYTKMISSAWKYSGAQRSQALRRRAYSHQLGRVARGGGTSRLNTQRPSLPSRSVPLIGGDHAGFLRALQAAQSRTTGYFSNLARGG